MPNPPKELQFGAIIFNMKFLLIKVPHNNEYTYEQGLALISSLVSKSQGIKIPFISKQKSPVYSFNIISVKQNIYFVIGTRETELTHLKNQLLAQYGKADIVDLDSFSQIGEIDFSNIQFDELKLTKSANLPIKTMLGFQNVDPLGSVLSTMSRSPDPKALFWIQMILTPANQNWQKKASTRINAINASEIKSQRMQTESTLIQEKIKHYGFNVNMRLISDAQVNIGHMAGAFSLFSETNGNSLTTKSPNIFNKSKLLDAIKTHSEYGIKNLLNSLEIATLWHMPAGGLNIPNIKWGKRLQLDPPEDLPIATESSTDEEKKDITFIGKVNFKNRDHIFGIKGKDRLRHVYIVGKTGTGKSWFIDNMAIEDIRKGNGVAVLDPHGDAIDSIMEFIPKNRINDVCYFNPADPEYAYPLNILEVKNNNQKELVVSGIIAIFYKLYSESWGPRLEHILRNVLFTLVQSDDATLPDVMKILHEKKYRDKILSSVDDPQLHQFWKKEYEAMSEKFMSEAISPILNKVGQFVTSPLIRRIIAHKKSKVIISELMDNKKIFLADLSQGKIGEDNATLLGSMLITQIQVAAMNRAFQAESDRVPFYLYVDEFQNFATSSFTKILSEARKYKLGLTLANQYITQIDENVMGAILGNVGTIACFNVGARDSEILYKEFGSSVEADDLTTLDSYQMIIRMMISSVTTGAFTYYSLPLPKNKSGHKEKIIEHSRRTYGIKFNK